MGTAASVLLLVVPLGLLALAVLAYVFFHPLTGAPAGPEALPEKGDGEGAS